MTDKQEATARKLIKEHKKVGSPASMWWAHTEAPDLLEAALAEIERLEKLIPR